MHVGLKQIDTIYYIKTRYLDSGQRRSQVLPLDICIKCYDMQFFLLLCIVRSPLHSDQKKGKFLQYFLSKFKKTFWHVFVIFRWQNT